MPRVEVLPLALIVLTCALVLTFCVRRLALARGLMDVPNERSSHLAPTPRGGGIAIVVTSLGAYLWLFLAGELDRAAFCALLAGIPVAVIGFIDDRRKVRTALRLAVHAGAAAWALWWVGGLPAMPVGDHLWSSPLGGTVLGLLGIVWSINFFNFMDGIDGIAGSEGTFVTWAGAALYLAAHGAAGPALASVALGAACLGFLVWNWPPARIFMGDVGSGYVGFCIAVLTILATRDVPQMAFVWWILGGVFFVDATVTLSRRVARGQRADEPHRSHAYQRISRRLASHAVATGAVQAVNFLWLLPCAYFANLYPKDSFLITCAALLPVVLGVLWLGAGRADGN